jgi:NifU-like protein
MWEYTDKVKDHFLHPRNVGEIPDADGIGEVGSLACGDALKLTFKLDENKRIKDAKFKTFGCASAIASSSALTEMLKGLSLEEAEKLSNENIAEYLGGLPKEKMHCSVMGRDALEKAIAYYRGESQKKVEGEIVCECFGVTDMEIKRVVAEHGLIRVEDVTDYTKAGGGCGKCHDRIQQIIQQINGIQIQPKKKEKALTNIQKIKLIEETLSREIQPALAKDGGNIELVDISGKQVYVALRGSCANCVASSVTLKNLVETKLREFVEEGIEVIEAK